MHPIKQARALVLAQVAAGPTEVVPLASLMGRVIAQPLVISHDLPRFDSSAVDGYALQVADVAYATEENPSMLRLQESRVAAGTASREKVQRGTAQRILTGALVPEGAEAIVMQEWTTESGGSVTVRRAVWPGENIRRRGDEYRAGTVALPAGARLNAAGVGLAVSLGAVELPVYTRPRVAIVTTGNEIIEPGKTLAEAQIYNSNLWTLRSALQSLGTEAVYTAHTVDEIKETRSQLASALQQADVLITAGGVSVGETDHVRAALRDLGVTLHFETVAMKPGKPTCFGTKGRQLVFGLPGNPAAVLVSFHHFVKPALRRWEGESDVEPMRLTAILARSVKKKAGRAEYVRGRLWPADAQLHVEPTAGQDSHMLGGLATANCLIYFPLELETLVEGSAVEVEWL